MRTAIVWCLAISGGRIAALGQKLTKFGFWLMTAADKFERWKWQPFG